ncbi:MAG: anion permease, partial [Selenomonadaceae bacterium]|nr:anion permease [Selenomonadaceae bacterium]
GISLGSAILSTKAATWIAHVIVDGFSLYTMSAVAIIGVMSLFLILIHLGFASATALSSAMIPIIISVLQGASEHAPLNVVGMTMILQYVMCFGFILPVNAPQNMVAFSTETFEARTFVKTGIPLTIIAFGVIMLMSVTYWSWLGII